MDMTLGDIIVSVLIGAGLGWAVGYAWLWLNKKEE